MRFLEEEEVTQPQPGADRARRAAPATVAGVTTPQPAVHGLRSPMPPTGIRPRLLPIEGPLYRTTHGRWLSGSGGERARDRALHFARQVRQVHYPHALRPLSKARVWRTFPGHLGDSIMIPCDSRSKVCQCDTIGVHNGV